MNRTKLSVQIFPSAADLKVLHRVQLARTRNFKSKSGTCIMELLERVRI
jgi:hypothetical protein